MPRLLKSLLDVNRLEEEDYVFTLDHDGGLVVSLEALEGSMNVQLAALQTLSALRLERNRADHENSPPADPISTDQSEESSAAR